ncbi:hypothetical protein JST99_03610 [Candidatus Dependentiae bacterium]|nr:hypothetical protein [Candidatus Dependentiae bacterium]MCC7414939.1 hypothetical protein [Campylobacterota bacterium]
MNAAFHSIRVLVAVVLFCSRDVVGWILPIGNATPYTARIEVAYFGCNSNREVLSPGDQVNIDAAGCLVDQIGIIFEKAQRGNPPKDVSLNWKVPGHRDFWATLRQKPDGALTLEADYGKGPIQEAFVKPIVNAFNQLGSDINKNVIQPIDFNVVKPIVGIGDTIGNIVSMAILIKGMIGPLQQTVATITKQVDSLASIKKGADVVDPIFIILRELTTLPPHFQAVLDKIAGSMSSIEDIVRPSSARDAEKIRQAGLAIASISKSVDEMTRKIAHLNRLLHVRVKSIAQSADEMTAQIIEVVK